jgi:protein-S-isoprenylcysteine O-methyltransferase Ste14
MESRIITGLGTDISLFGLLALALLTVSMVADGFLSKRYRAGDGRLDHQSCQHLIISLTSFFVVLLASWQLGFGLVNLPPWLEGLGLTLVAGGTFLRYAAIFQLGSLFTWQIAILDAHQLKTDGLYRWMRHPSYTGGLLAIVGASLVFESIVALVVAVMIHAPMVLRRVRLEEIALRLHFGAHFESYAGRTARLVPFVY